jgi:hypothetical protein
MIIIPKSKYQVETCSRIKSKSICKIYTAVFLRKETLFDGTQPDDVSCNYRYNLSLSTPWRRVGGVEIQLRSFLTSAVDGVEWSASHSGRFVLETNPGTHCTGSWVGPRIGLDDTESREFFSPYRDEIYLSLKYLSGGYLVSRIGGQRN